MAMPQPEERTLIFVGEPCNRRMVRSVSRLCAAAPAFRDAIGMGAAPLLRAVDEDPVISRRLLELSRSMAPPQAQGAHMAFEQLLILLIQDLKDNGVEEVIAVGAGEYGRTFARLAQIANVRVRCFADRDVELQGTTVEGAAVVSHEEACSIRDIPLVVTSKSSCQTIVEGLGRLLHDQDRLVYAHINSWRSQLEHDPALNAAYAVCHGLLREAIANGSPWATAYLLCNFRWFVHLWRLPESVEPKAMTVSPFVYQMQ